MAASSTGEANSNLADPGSSVIRNHSWGSWQDTETTVGFQNGDFVEFHFDTSGAPTGFDLTSIVTSAWWSLASSGRTEHHYSVSISYLGDPGFVELAPMTHYSPGNSAEVTQITLFNQEGGYLNGTNPATGVDAIRFDFGGNPINGEGATAGGGWNGLREIDVFGIPSAGRSNTPTITSITIDGNTATLTFTGRPSSTYLCKGSTDLEAFPTIVTPISGSLTTNDQGQGTFTVELLESRRFFALEEE